MFDPAVFAARRDAYMRALGPTGVAVVRSLPERLRNLIERSRALQSAVRRLDATIHVSPTHPPPQIGNPVERQLGLLRAAFEQDGL